MAANAEVVTTALTGEFLRGYPGEVASVVEGWPSEDIEDLFQHESVEQLVPVFEYLTPAAASQLLESLDAERASSLLGRVDAGHAASLLARLAPAKVDALVAQLSPAATAELRELMAYPPDTAGSLMDVYVPTIRPETRAASALERARGDHRVQGGDLVVVDGEGGLEGILPIEEVALASPETPVRALLRGAPASIHALAPREDVVEQLSRLQLESLPVVDAHNRVVGIIRHSALVRAAEEEASVDMQTMVGVSAEERALSPVGFAVKKRLPWLQINLLTAFLAAAVVGIFEDTIARFTALAVLLPVVAGQSGNTGAQALAVTMRGLSLREIRLRHWPRVLMKEGSVALLNGIGVALTTSIAVYVWSRSTGLAMVIGMSMVISMACAGVAGALVPMGLVAVNQDPAQSSSIILTTVTDVVGFLSFLGIATLLAGSL